MASCELHLTRLKQPDISEGAQNQLGMITVLPNKFPLATASCLSTQPQEASTAPHPILLDVLLNLK